MEHTERELQVYSALQEIEGAFSRQGADAVASQFRNDFERLAFQIVDQDWHLPPAPHNSPSFAPFRIAPIPRRLPFGPLRRMVRFLGIETLKYLLRMGSDDSFERYRLELRKRLLKEMPDGGERCKSAKRNVELIKFGSLVLSFEEEGYGRGKARLLAAMEMGNKFKNRNDRTLIPDNHAASATGKLTKLMADWTRRRGARILWAWARENDKGKGSHLHLLIACPAHLPIGRMWRRWLRAITGKPYRAGTINTRRIGGSLAMAAADPAAYRHHLFKAATYVCKGVRPDDAAGLGIKRVEDGGRVIGKRSAVCQFLRISSQYS